MKSLKQFTLVVLFTILVLPTSAQKFSLDNETSFLQVLGTSTLHDWYIQVENQTGFIQFEDVTTNKVAKLEFSTESESFKSGKKGMDKKTYKALRTDEFKTIKFSLTAVKSVSDNSSNQFKLTAVGNLTICGVTKSIELQFDCEKKDNLIVLSGAHKMLMTDFGIDPPKALLGTIKTGDEIEVKFKSIFIN